jgi:hypothetical protein
VNLNNSSNNNNNNNNNNNSINDEHFERFPIASSLQQMRNRNVFKSKMYTTNFKPKPEAHYKIWRSHNDGHEELYLLGYNTV